MKKKLYITRTVKLICFFLALALTLGFLQTYVLRNLDQNSIRYDGFYQEEKDSLDVVLVGASEVYTGYSAGLAYEKYGYTSYPLAAAAINAECTLQTLKEVVREQKPKLVLIEINSYVPSNCNNEVNDAHVHTVIDNIPLTADKIDFINNKVPAENRLEYYVPLIKYHGTWTDLPKPKGRRVVSKIAQDIRGISVLKGFRTTTGKQKVQYKILNDQLEKETKADPMNPELEKKLRELLDYCKEQKLNAVFYRAPHMIYKDTYARAKRNITAGKIINSYGYDFLNLERDYKKTGIKLYDDFYNLDHLNIYGAVKFTNYLGGVIRDKYGIKPSKLEGKQKQNWDESAVAFQQLYRYCDDLYAHNKTTNLEEDINTLSDIKKYAD